MPSRACQSRRARSNCSGPETPRNEAAYPGVDARFQAAEGDREINVLVRPRCQVQVKAHGPGSIAEFIADIGPRRRLALDQVPDHRVLGEGGRTECAGFGQGNHRLVPVDPERAVEKAQLPNRAGAAERPPALPGRGHLERPQHRKEAQRLALAGGICHAVAKIENGPAGFAGCKSGDLEAQAPGSPPHAGNGQKRLRQFLLQSHIRPADEPLVGIEKRRDRKSALVHFHLALFVHQGLGVARAGSGNRPVGLPAQEVFRIHAGGLVGRYVLEEVIQAAGEVVRLDRNVPDAETAAAGTGMKIEPQVARNGLRQVKVAAAGIRLARGVGGLPGGAVIRDLDIEPPGLQPLDPVNDQPAVFPFLLKVDEKPLRVLADLALPACGRRGREGVLRFVTRKRAGGAHARRQPVGVVAKPKALEPHRARPALACGDHQFDGRHVLRRPAAQRPPRKDNLAASNLQRLPVVRKVEGFDPVAPDVLIGVVHQLEFEYVGRKGAADVDPERVALGNVERIFLAGAHKTAAAPEIDIQPHGPAVAALVPADVDPGLAGGDGRPGRNIVKIIQNRFLHGGSPKKRAME